MDYKRLGLNGQENDLILSEYKEEELVPVTPSFQAYVRQTEQLPRALRPALKEHAEGPFSLNVYNQGLQIENSMLVFELKVDSPEKPNEQKPNTILTEPLGNISRSLAVIPFVDVFRTQITQEAQRAEELIKTSKVQNLQNPREELELLNLVRRAHQYGRTLEERSKKASLYGNDNEEPAPKTPTGKESVIDSLASTISASSAFYNSIWSQMTEFFDPAFRHIGEQYALGNTSLESPMKIRL